MSRKMASSSGEQSPGQVVLVLQGGGALGAYQVAQCRFSLRPPSEESGVNFPSGCVAQTSRIRQTACRNTGLGTSSSPDSQHSRLSAVVLSACSGVRTP